MFHIRDYEYHLPQELIAQAPVTRRDQSRLLTVDRERGTLSDQHFFQLPDLLEPGDLLVANNTRVVQARIYGRKESGGRVEVVVLEHPQTKTPNPETRLCLMKSSKRPKPGSRLFFENGLTGVVEGHAERGLVRITFRGEQGIDAFLEQAGGLPLPPYIKRDAESPLNALDRERYQTIYSENPGAVAAPTAGLHFTKPLMERLAQRGVSVTYLTLHVGYDTFRPVEADDIREHTLGGEYYRVEDETADRINRTRKNGGRVFAVGTTVVRTLEASQSRGRVVPGTGHTTLLITPGHRFGAVDGMITNFHLPKSSLLFLVAAFAGLDLIQKAYAHAVLNRYRFYSYGDAMLIH
ncbi:MAG: tRNA preQ1(34) S-adenosylmethionine ribosyltransferase-isomerase QueA [Deltaproteobacteria bacterium]|nr:tRNA preQ1(34) S-adenosylmethionine ribosyltransferase-isomerase QueA [Deltaproteobacteria bacterium]